MLTNIQ